MRNDTLNRPASPAPGFPHPVPYARPVPFVYLLRCRDGSLYAGATKDLRARLRAHASGRASRYTRARLPVTLV